MFQIMILNLALLNVNFFGIDILKEPYVEERLDAFHQEISKHADVDLIAFQEVFSLHHKKLLAKQFKTTHPYAVYHPDKKLGLGLENDLMILSKHPILTQDFLAFENGFWSGYYFVNLGILSVEIEHPLLGSVGIVNTHLSSSTLGAKTESVKADELRLKQIKQTIVYSQNNNISFVVGDFNTGPSSNPTKLNSDSSKRYKEVSVSNYNYFIENGFADSVALCQKLKRKECGDKPTWDPANPLNNKGSDYFVDSLAQRVDHIFTNQLQGAKAHRIETVSVERLFDESLVPVKDKQGNQKYVPLSDHYGVLATFKID